MNTLLTALLMVASEGAPAAVLDPGRLIPEGLPVFVEVLEPSKMVARLGKSSGFKALEEDLPADLRVLLDLITKSGLKRAALGLDHSFLRSKTTFVLLLEGADPDATFKQAREIAEKSNRPVFKAGPFVGIADSAGTANDVRDVAIGDEESVLDRKDFMTFRQRVTSGEIRFHVNLKGLFPLRPGVASPKNAGSALLLAHVLHAAGRSREVSGHVDLSGGLALNIDAPVGTLPADRRFCTPGDPGHAVLAGPSDQAARLSMRRDLAGFWKNVEKLVPAGSLPELAAFRSNAERLTGGITVEELCAGLGTTFDLHVAPLPPMNGPPPRNRYPMGAVVAQVTDDEIADKLMLAFKEAIGAFNLEASRDARPPLTLGSKQHGGLTILTARYLPDQLPAKDDDRLQLEIAMALVGKRLIIGSHTHLVSQLVDDALENRVRAREPGDVARVTAANVRQLVKDARAAIAAGLVIDGQRTVDGGEALVEHLGWFLERAEAMNIDIVFGAERATLKMDIIAPDLWKPDSPK